MAQLNVGNFDRAIRIVLGLALVGLAVFGKVGPWGYLGIVALLTGMGAWCPLYSALRFTTTAR